MDKTLRPLKFKYKIVKINLFGKKINDIEVELDKYGELGWELCAIRSEDDIYLLVGIFKRKEYDG